MRLRRRWGFLSMIVNQDRFRVFEGVPRDLFLKKGICCELTNLKNEKMFVAVLNVPNWTRYATISTQPISIYWWNKMSCMNCFLPALCFQKVVTTKTRLFSAYFSGVTANTNRRSLFCFNYSPSFIEMDQTIRYTSEICMLLLTG